MKYMSLGEAETKRQKAIEMLRRLGNDEAASEFEGTTPEKYAQRKDAQLLENPFRRNTMAQRRKTIVELEAEVGDLQDQLGDLEEENENLQDQLNQIAGIAGGEGEGEEDEASDEDDERD